VTLCNPRGHDVGEYVRAIFNNFAFLEHPNVKSGKVTVTLRVYFSKCQIAFFSLVIIGPYDIKLYLGKSAKLKKMFKPFLDVISSQMLGSQLIDWSG
jgi:hypothetical protein